MASHDDGGLKGWRAGFEAAPEMVSRRVVANIVLDFWDGPRAGILQVGDPDEYFAYEEAARKRNAQGLDWIVAEVWPVSANEAAVLHGLLEGEHSEFADEFFRQSRNVTVLGYDVVDS